MLILAPAYALPVILGAGDRVLIDQPLGQGQDWPVASLDAGSLWEHARDELTWRSARAARSAEGVRHKDRQFW
jgi:hypothetical protein